MSKKKVLVTGATGYIGAHLCKILHQNNIEVEAVDANIHESSNDVSAYVKKFTELDVTQSIPKRISNKKYDAVVHLAGMSTVGDSWINPFEFYRVNIMGTAIVASTIQTDHFIFASTASAWGMDSPYARSKVAAEDVIKQICPAFTIFRFFNVSGSDGEFSQHGESTHLIRVAAEVAAGKRDTLTVNGDDYDTPDGTCVRDYIHVVDLCNSILASINGGPKNTPFESLGTTKGQSVHEVVRAMQHATGEKVPVVIGPRRPGDTPMSVVDTPSEYNVVTKSLEDMCLDQYTLEKNNEQ